MVMESGETPSGCNYNPKFHKVHNQGDILHEQNPTLKE